jgi:hypothetical protein
LSGSSSNDEGGGRIIFGVRGDDRGECFTLAFVAGEKGLCQYFDTFRVGVHQQWRLEEN